METKQAVVFTLAIAGIIVLIASFFFYWYTIGIDVTTQEVGSRRVNLAISPALGLRADVEGTVLTADQLAVFSKLEFLPMIGGLSVIEVFRLLLLVLLLIAPVMMLLSLMARRPGTGKKMIFGGINALLSIVVVFIVFLAIQKYASVTFDKPLPLGPISLTSLTISSFDLLLGAFILIAAAALLIIGGALSWMHLEKKGLF
jgi:membrane-associated HD superfamily phosphohydrolase